MRARPNLVAAIVAFGANGCSFQPGYLPGDGAPADGARDGRDDAATAGENCYGASPFAVCLTTTPSAALPLSNTTISTNDGDCPGEIVTPTTSPALCVLAGTSVTITGTVRGEGTRPLVIVATQGSITVELTATLDVSSKATEALSGAGANDGSCILAPGGTNTGGAGGGAGGSFGTTGGRGGNGVASGGLAAAATTPSTVRGGCPGGKGGDGGGTGGAGGDSGGSVYLVAETTLSIAGTINASGEGGKLGPTGKNGGGGGGSGGMVALYGRMALSVTGSIFANGGGGGGGGDSSAGQNGRESTDPTNVAMGGNNGGANAGAGGAGAIDTQSGMQGGDASKPGGGGGGGVGVVVNVSGQPIGGTVSPPPM